MKHVFSVWLHGTLVDTLVYTRKVTAAKVKKDLIGEGSHPDIIVVKRRVR